MGLDASLDPVKDGSQVQLAFECAEDGFNVGELDVLLPELLGIAIGQIGAKQIGALMEPGTAQLFPVSAPDQTRVG